MKRFTFSFRRLMFALAATFAFGYSVKTEAQNFQQMIKLAESSRQPYVTGRDASDQFGYSVAVSGDFAIVGAPFEDEDAAGDNTIPGAGCAYIFVRNGTNWTMQQKIVASDRATNDNFGISVAISGNYAIVGA